MSEVNLETWPFKDRRADERIPAQWQVTHRRPGGKLAVAVTSNVCCNGVCFATNIRYKTGEQIEMDVSVGRMKFFRCTAAISRAERSPGGLWEYGVEFQRMSRQDMAILVDALTLLASEHDRAVAAAARSGAAPVPAQSEEKEAQVTV